MAGFDLCEALIDAGSHGVDHPSPPAGSTPAGREAQAAQRSAGGRSSSKSSSMDARSGMSTASSIRGHPQVLIARVHGVGIVRPRRGLLRGDDRRRGLVGLLDDGREVVGGREQPRLHGLQLIQQRLTARAEPRERAFGLHPRLLQELQALGAGLLGPGLGVHADALGLRTGLGQDARRLGLGLGDEALRLLVSGAEESREALAEHLVRVGPRRRRCVLTPGLHDLRRGGSDHILRRAQLVLERLHAVRDGQEEAANLFGVVAAPDRGELAAADLICDWAGAEDRGQAWGTASRIDGLRPSSGGEGPMQRPRGIGLGDRVRGRGRPCPPRSAAGAVSASQRRTSPNDAIATSICAASGSSVVIFWSQMPGAISAAHERRVREAGAQAQGLVRDAGDDGDGHQSRSDPPPDPRCADEREHQDGHDHHDDEEVRPAADVLLRERIDVRRIERFIVLVRGDGLVLRAVILEHAAHLLEAPDEPEVPHQQPHAEHAFEHEDPSAVAVVMSRPHEQRRRTQDEDGHEEHQGHGRARCPPAWRRADRPPPATGSRPPSWRGSR